MSVSSNVIKCNDDLYTYNEEVERGQTKKKKNNEKTICMIWYSAPEGAVFLACLLFYWRKRRPMRSSGECASVCACVRACVRVRVCVCVSSEISKILYLCCIKGNYSNFIHFNFLPLVCGARG